MERGGWSGGEVDGGGSTLASPDKCFWGRISEGPPLLPFAFPLTFTPLHITLTHFFFCDLFRPSALYPFRYVNLD